ncbi:MAG: DUF1559 domain-containing protein, partial [Planctomycetales bacterium]|nr:DUF1559 domain-containing protein [Planctomycetales bacterium]NIP68409.1 DUF1559 domain-containing protein [Planctomycetales bacterium]
RQCANNLKQIGLAILSYEAQHGCFPPGGLHYPREVDITCCMDPNCSTRTQACNRWNQPQYGKTNWAIAILPYIEEEKLYGDYDHNLFNSDAANSPVLKTFLPAMTCPSDEGTDELVTGMHYVGGQAAAPGSYKGVAGKSPRGPGGRPGRPFWDFPSDQLSALSNVDRRGPLHAVTVGEGLSLLSCVRTMEIRDGLTHTLLVGEKHLADGPGGPVWGATWQKINISSVQRESPLHGYPVRTDECFVLIGDNRNCVRAFNSLHSGHVMNFVTCSGNVFPILPDINGEVFVALGTIAGGEVEFLE